MSMDDQISKAKEEAFSRKVIMEKVEKWMSAREEERWLEDSVSRGAHKHLRRAERARVMVNKIPGKVKKVFSIFTNPKRVASSFELNQQQSKSFKKM